MINFNLENIIYKNINFKHIIQPKRAQIYVGFQCHQQCKFCYYINRCNEPMFSLDYIKKQIDFEYEYGIRNFEITGGEPSEYNQLREVCQYIKQKNKNSKIAIITNGGLWKSNIWDLIDEVLISYHIGKNDPNINKIFFPLGHTYYKVKKTIDKANENNILIRTNTVLGTFNINNIDYIIDDLIFFKPAIINFLPVNLFDNTTDLLENTIDYNVLRPILKNSIDKLKYNLKHVFINIRYMPFCNMEGYEQHILGQLQHIYDIYDWNREIGGTNIFKLIENFENNLKTLGKFGSTSIQSALNTRNIFYEKTSKCLSCKYYILCDGVEKTKSHLLVKYIQPSIGKYIKNILHFYKQYNIFK